MKLEERGTRRRKAKELTDGGCLTIKSEKGKYLVFCFLLLWGMEETSR